MNPKEVEKIKQRYRILGNNRKLNECVSIAINVAPTEVSVLVLGESGVGKDVFGRIIHDLSHRKHKPYLAINCAAIPEGTLDSELFGHERGAFTSAYEARKGYFEEADGGTLFLDEIGEMPLHTQARLLRVLESGEYFRVGSSKVRKTDVRVVAATNKNLLELIRQGKFREDLYYRLNTVTINVPPLRERGEDIILLMEYYLLEFSEKYFKQIPELTEDAKQLLLKYRWHGNIRELRNLAEKIVILSEGDIIDSAKLIELYPQLSQSYLPVLANPQQFTQSNYEYYSQWESVEGQYENGSEIPYPGTSGLTKILKEMHRDLKELKRLIVGGFLINKDHSDGNMALPMSVAPAKSTQEQEPESLSLRDNEKRLIQLALKKFYGNRKKAAKSLGISERTLYRKIKQYDIDIEDDE